MTRFFVFFLSSTDIDDCNPHPWYVITIVVRLYFSIHFFLPPFIVWTLHRRGWLQGWWAFNDQQNLPLNWASKRRGEVCSDIMNRTVRGGSFFFFFKDWIRVPPTLWWMQVGGVGVKVGGWVAKMSCRGLFFLCDLGGAQLWGGCKEGTMRGGTGHAY